MVKIMIVEDDRGIQEAMELMLSMNGYKVTTSEDGREILKMNDGELPDVILLDVWMPIVDGRVLCRMLKEDKRTKKIPVIFVSASRELEQITRDCGAEDYLAKPFDMEELLDKVNHYTQEG